MRFFVFALAAPLLLQTASAQSCDRECLRGIMTQYLNAMVKHDPKAAPLAANVRFAEDSIDKPIGEGFWKTISGLGTFRQDIIDVKDGISGTHVMADEAGKPVMLAVRLKVVDKKIAEADTLVVKNREEGMIFNPAPLTKASEAMNITPTAAQKTPRAEMERLALLYPAGLKNGSFVKVDAQFDPNAYRLENGQLMAGPGCTFIAGCDHIKEQRLPTLSGITAKVAGVDEEQGIVWLNMNFGPGSVMGAPGGPPKTLMVFEMFKIYDGKINAVEAFMKSMPAGTKWIWER